MAVELWAVRLERDLTEQEDALLLSVLPEQRKDRLLRMKRPEKRSAILCAYGALYAAVAAQNPLRGGLPEMEYGALGKPVFVNEPKLHFSLSHTDGAVLAGISDAPVGVDIERIRPVREPLKMRLGGGTPEEVFANWTRREARAKRTGTAVALREEPPLSPEEILLQPTLFEGFAACVCTSDIRNLQIHCMTQEELLRRVMVASV